MTETGTPITGRNSLQTRKVSKALWVAKTVGLCPRKACIIMQTLAGWGWGNGIYYGHLKVDNVLFSEI